VVEEEKVEDDKDTNLRRRQARFKMVKDKNEFNKKSKRNRSTELIKEVNNGLFGHNFGDVAENEEEEISDSSIEKLKT